jgi:cytochrome c553
MLDQRCDECHGADGNGNGERPERKYAKLAGQTSVYMIKQWQDYSNGARKYDLMAMLASNLEGADMADISAYFASLQLMHGDDSANEVGRSLFVHDDAGRNILPRESCHRANLSNDMIVTVIAGQEK